MDALAAITRVDLARGQRDQAIKRLDSAVAANPKNAVARNLLGETMMSAENYNGRHPDAHRGDQGGAEVVDALAQPRACADGAGDKAAGTATYEAGIRAAGPEVMLVAELSAIYEKQGRVDDAIKQYEALHTRNPRLELAANNLAMLLITYRSDKVSLDRARSLTESFAKTNNGALLDTHGWVIYKQGQFSAALPVLERASSSAPDSNLIRYHLAMAQLKTGLRDQARDNLKHALSGQATFAGADEARTTLASLGGAG